MKKISIMMLFAALLCCSCAKPEAVELDDDVTLSALVAYVYPDEENFSVKEEVDLLSGMYIEEKGSASYTFPDDAARFNAATLKRCRIEATVAATSRVELTDESGKGIGVGLGGWHDLYNQTIYLKVIAANGDIKQYKINCKCKN